MSSTYSPDAGPQWANDGSDDGNVAHTMGDSGEKDPWWQVTLATSVRGQLKSLNDA